MLNKEICERCFLLLSQQHKVWTLEELHRKFERAWTDNGCLCYYKFGGEPLVYTHISSLMNPPKDCPYLLEQTLVQDEANVK